jgi:hypothetical protein
MPMEALPAKGADGWKQPGAATVVPVTANRFPSFTHRCIAPVRSALREARSPIAFLPPLRKTPTPNP